MIFEKATKVNYKSMEDLAAVWCDWAEMELRHTNYKQAVEVMKRACAPTRKRYAYVDNLLRHLTYLSPSVEAAGDKAEKQFPVQDRLYKSTRIWSLYCDLEESLGTVDTTKAAYDQMIKSRSRHTKDDSELCQLP